MFIPAMFRLDDRAAAVELIRQNSFGLLVTALEGRATATHLPFLFDPERGEQGTLIAHMARTNPQWRDFAALEAADGEALAVFQGAHAYVSPTWYGGEGPRVPTWNYMAVHAYGRPRIVEEPASVRVILARLVETHEAGLTSPWSMESQEAKFLESMMRGIVAFEMPVTRLEAKAKLSQNRTTEQRAGVLAALEADADPVTQEVARQMRVLVE